MKSSAIQLVVGLGNPGAEYVLTRHNAGFWFVDALARAYGATFKHERKFNGDVCRITIGGHDLRLLKPDTFMNRSGQAVQPLASYLKIPAEAILVAHDDLDLPTGTVRLKRGGGHGGHNGLRDISTQIGADYYRLRFGIGNEYPKGGQVDYVLGEWTEEQKKALAEKIKEAVEAVSAFGLAGIQTAMNEYNS